MEAFPDPGVSADRVRADYDRDALPLVLQARGATVIHASAALGPRGALLFAADSGTGKSTLAAALAARGWRALADDCCAIEDGRLHPLPFAGKLRPDVAATLRAPSGAGGEPVGIAALFLLKRRPGPPAVSPVEPKAAVTALLAHAFCATLQEGELKRAFVERLLDVAARVKILELGFEPGPLEPVLDLLSR